jgi:hypothetical protein
VATIVLLLKCGVPGKVKAWIFVSKKSKLSLIGNPDPNALRGNKIRKPGYLYAYRELAGENQPCFHLKALKM